MAKRQGGCQRVARRPYVAKRQGGCHRGHKVIEWPRRTKGGHGVNKGGHGVARWQGGAIVAGRWLQRRP